ncbi:MAG: hypothetical protein NZ740_05825 [Kiritimatiellae bacterium]|nr:hypothetical protein [Kiritimatiellia bacterium]MDW8458611.1 hypothetical protein [Verrucomicrobiota bacterium]
MFYPQPARISEKPSLKPLLYSAAIFPGVGQWLQRRIVACCVYGGAGAVATLIFLNVLWLKGPDAVRILVDAWTTGVDPEEARAVFLPLVKSSVFLIAVYLANVYDTWYAWRKAMIAWKASAQQPREG